MSLETRIAEALRQLVSQSNDDYFVFVEGGSDGQFVQFAKAGSGAFILDLPLINLSEEEQNRARQLFSEAPGSTQSEDGYSVQYSADAIPTAAKVTLRVFSEVFKLPADAPITITTS